jgi:hypothetical protein
MLREAGAVQLLVTLMDSTDHELQQAAAGAIANIRRCVSFFLLLLFGAFLQEVDDWSLFLTRGHRWHLLFSEHGPDFASRLAAMQKVEE